METKESFATIFLSFTATSLTPADQRIGISIIGAVTQTFGFKFDQFLSEIVPE